MGVLDVARQQVLSSKTVQNTADFHFGKQKLKHKPDVLFMLSVKCKTEIPTTRKNAIFFMFQIKCGDPAEMVVEETN